MLFFNVTLFCKCVKPTVTDEHLQLPRSYHEQCLETSSVFFYFKFCLVVLLGLGYHFMIDSGMICPGTATTIFSTLK